MHCLLLLSFPSTNTNMYAGKHICASKAHRAFYTRSKTCKAPRKRQQLLLLSRRTSAEGLSCVVAHGAGGNGPKGPVDKPAQRRWNDDDSGNGWNPSLNVVPVSVALVLASMAVAGAGPAVAEASLVDRSEEESLIFVDAEGTDFEGTAGGAVFQLLPKSYSPTAFTEEEKQLVCPRQYRYRETVYVH